MEKFDYRVIADGGSRRNGSPDAKGYGSYQLASRTGDKAIFRIDVGVGVTNNQAEYAAIIAGVRDLICRIVKARVSVDTFTLVIYTDSQLVAKQLTGVYKVKSPRLIPYHKELSTHISRFKEVEIRHVPRTKIEAVLGH